MNLEQMCRLLDFYDSKGILHRVDGDRPIEYVTESIYKQILTTGVQRGKR
ncbi:hypothetical protein [Laceyella putida]|uniref:Uncharacterized protein n=1 Tax=Laceyella putida TaxID=110101 RepID=A0ABW2RQ15_9BACL